jgi:imidazolonepropionase-like amidohydrolase
MPGIFDCHTHLAMSTTDLIANLRRPVSRWALDAAANAAATVRAGVTFARDAAGADAGLRDAIAAGDVIGPRLQVAVVMISQTGGHADGFLPGSGHECFTQYLIPDHPGRPRFLADGVDDMRGVVREVLRAGADWIKLCATGGFLSEHDEPTASELTLDEIRCAVDEAGRRGRHVMVHAYGGAGVDHAVAAGVRSVEHGTFLTEEQAAAMAAAGCFLVPTLATFSDLVSWAQRGELGPAANAKVLARASTLGQCVAIAREHGVRIATGCDFLTREQHGCNLRELALLGRAGMSAEEVLLAATATGAALCGVADSVGALEPGLRFDAIVLDQEPGDLEIFAADVSPVTAVFAGGRVVTTHERWRGTVTGTGVHCG